MTPAELARAKEICEKATQGPWKILYDGRLVDGVYAGETRIVETDSGFYPPRDSEAEFIAEARTLLPKAIAEIERLQKQINEVLK